MPTGEIKPPRASILALFIAREAADLACEAAGVRLDDIYAPTRGRARAVFARQVAMYLAHVVGQLTMTDVARVFGRDRTTVAYALHLIEDRRDDPDFDAAMERLEALIRPRIVALRRREDEGVFNEAAARRRAQRILQRVRGPGPAPDNSRTRQRRRFG